MQCDDEDEHVLARSNATNKIDLKGTKNFKALISYALNDLTYYSRIVFPHRSILGEFSM